MTKDTTLYRLDAVGKEFQGPVEKVVIFESLNLEITAGDSIAVVGASGSGKSTLLHLLGALDSPSSGTVMFQGRSMDGMSAGQKAAVRNRDIGFVFQFHHLLPEFSTQENVAMQAMIAGVPRREALRKAVEMLDLVGIADRRRHRVGTLSGGERQRAAIARAILMRPRVLLADEPTGNLDERTGDSVGHLLLQLNKDLGMTLVVVTHNVALAALMKKCLELRAGELYGKNW